MNKSIHWKDIAELMGIIAIVLSLVLVAYELRQNTTMMRAQTRDSLTEKQMMFSEWVATNEYTARAAIEVNSGDALPGSPEFLSVQFLTQGILREWENSFYQFEQGLFEVEEFEPRRLRWHTVMTVPSIRAYWADSREEYSPRFREELDEIVQKIEDELGANQKPD